ncbi:hypothetical protein OC834_001005 [Tilletia horrida]|uniref:Eukaryotic translation initiation factor 3 subunit F n=1 Tax=Tilletia horrida TaxID=155126 RepID=A0AAN6JM57_9BASI|nr:hypothetical protein OC834_001005 [Tilletia horrida]KAK0537741.1 hypothetical protein OC842_001537 [Tilletia horrida]
MSLAAPASSSALHLNFPPSTSSGGVLHSRSLTGVGVHPVALFSILDHYLRRSDAAAAEATAKAQGAVAGKKSGAAAGGDADGAEDDADESGRRTGDAAGKAAKKDVAAPAHVRVIGTLLGIRTESEIEIRSAFAIPHKETEEQVEVDIEYHRKMAELHAKTHPGEVIVGWYATGRELNTYSALIQDLFSKETAPHQAVHLTFDTELNTSRTAESSSASGAESDALGVRAYVSSPLGLVPKAENAVFVPLPVTLLQTAAERPALNLLAQTASASASSPSQQQTQSQSQSQSQSQLPAAGPGPVSDMVALTRALTQVQDQLDRVLSYVRDVLDGKRAGSPAVGRYLIDTVAMAPGGIAPEKLESLFNGHLQDVLMVSYLANVVRAQAEISTRLNLLT